MKVFGIGIPFGKSGIHIKKENEGKFTASAKAAGESVQEHAHNVVNNPNATTLLKKRALFAINAKKWKHEDGAKIHKPFGHTPVATANWSRSVKKRTRLSDSGPVVKGQDGIPGINTKSIEDKLTQKIIDNANRLESMKPMYQPEQEWIRNWYKNRQPLILNNLRESGYDMNLWSKLMDNLMQTTYYPSPLHLPESIYKLLTPHEKNVNWVEGMYLPKIQGVFFNSKSPGHSIKIHEFTHSQKPEIQKNLIEKHLKLQEGTIPSPYYDDPDEVNSRVMEFRYNNKLDPRKKYTIEEIKNMKPNGDGIEWLNGRPTDLLDRYDDETLLFLINDLATSKNELGSVKALNGIKLPISADFFTKNLINNAKLY